jgi:hypothetical protein
MKIDRVKLTLQIETPVGNQWVGLEAAIDDTETAETSLTRLKNIITGWANPNGQVVFDGSVAPGPSPVINVARKSEDTVVAELIRDMYRCTELGGDNGLFSFERLASGYPEAQAAYDVMKNKLRVRETKQILDATNALTEQINANPELKSKLLDGYNKNTKIKK